MGSVFLLSRGHSNLGDNERREQEESKMPLPFSPMADLKQEMTGRERKYD